MSVVDTTPSPVQSHPLAIRHPSKPVIESLDENSQARAAFLQRLSVKPSHYQQRLSKKSTTNYSSSIGSIVDRTPSNLFELKQQRLLAAADRKKRIIARIVSIVGLLIIVLCVAIVTLTLKMAPKIDELVRSKVGSHQSVPLVSRMNTPTRTSTTIMTIHQDNYTINGSVTDKLRRKPFI